MAAVHETTRSVHAAGRRADVYAQPMGYESAIIGANALQPARQHYKPTPASRIKSALMNLIIKIAGH